MSEFATRILASELPRTSPGTRVLVAGRVVLANETLVFLRDSSGSISLQGAALTCQPGDLVRAQGEWDGTRIVAARTELLGRPSRDPFAADSELARLWSTTPPIAQRLVQRSHALSSVRRYFETEQFLELHTPTCVSSPGLDVHLSAFELANVPEQRFLITSPEYQLKRLLAGGLERIYQLGPCFRRDEAGPLHEPEFTLLEWYRAFADVEAVMHDTEQLLCLVTRALNDGRSELVRNGRQIDVTPPWPRISVRDAFRQFADVNLDDILLDETRFYELLVTCVEPELGRDRPTFLVDYPAAMASLARLKPSNRSVAERFEAYVDGIELCNGFGELTDAKEQRARLVRDQAQRSALGLPVYPIDERFLSALEQGMPPSAGNALGFDRLVMLAAGASSIQDVTALPCARL